MIHPDEREVLLYLAHNAPASPTGCVGGGSMRTDHAHRIATAISAS